MTRHLWLHAGRIWERRACGALHCYEGEAALVMALVLRYSRPC